MVLLVQADWEWSEEDTRFRRWDQQRLENKSDMYEDVEGCGHGDFNYDGEMCNEKFGV